MLISGIHLSDPFKLEHNLAAGITEKVFRYIYRIFVNARKLFGESTEISPDDIMNHYFNVSSLKRGLTMPQDRLCKRCGKIGHVRKSCPERENNSKKGKRYINDRAKKGSSDVDGTFCQSCGKHGHSMSQCAVFLGGKKARETSRDRNKQDADDAGKGMSQEFNAFSKQKGNTPMKSKPAVGNSAQDNEAFLDLLSQLKVADSANKKSGASKKPTNHNINSRKNEMAETTLRESILTGGARKRLEPSVVHANELEKSQGIYSRNNGK